MKPEDNFTGNRFQRGVLTADSPRPVEPPLVESRSRGWGVGPARVMGHSLRRHEIVGAGVASSISAAYYPSVYQTWTKIGQRWLTNVIIDGAVFSMNEFWPDVNYKFFHQKD